LFLAAYLLVSGALSLVGQSGHSWPPIVAGAADFLSGMGAFGWAGVSARAPALLIATWALGSGSAQIWNGMSSRQIVRHSWLLTMAGVAAITLAAVSTVYRQAKPVSLFGVLAEFAIVWGELILILGWSMRGSRRAAVGLA
jgi:uncharacterized membrane protein HdeD (DUF308 family)